MNEKIQTFQRRYIVAATFQKMAHVQYMKKKKYILKYISTYNALVNLLLIELMTGDTILYLDVMNVCLFIDSAAGLMSSWPYFE